MPCGRLRESALGYYNISPGEKEAPKTVKGACFVGLRRVSCCDMIRENKDWSDLMRIVFVRHGHPDYKLDCLTELGHRHAEAAADRLADEPFTKIYSSTCGRAVETAEHIAARHNLPVESFDFMREIRWGSIDGEPLPHKGGYPWAVANAMVENGETLMDPNWAEEGAFANNSVKYLVQNIAVEFDKLLETLGYVREGEYYRVTRDNSETVAMVSHGGSGTAVLAHLFNIPFPMCCNMIRMDFTGITVVKFTGEEGTLTAPRFEILTDNRHIGNIDSEIVFGV